MIIKLNQDGSVDIPTPLLEELALEPGMALELTVEDGIIRLAPYEQLSAVQANEDDEPDAEVVADVKVERKEGYESRAEGGGGFG